MISKNCVFPGCDNEYLVAIKVAGNAKYCPACRKSAYYRRQHKGIKPSIHAFRDWEDKAKAGYTYRFSNSVEVLFDPSPDGYYRGAKFSVIESVQNLIIGVFAVGTILKTSKDLRMLDIDAGLYRVRKNPEDEKMELKLEQLPDVLMGMWA